MSNRKPTRPIQLGHAYEERDGKLVEIHRTEPITRLGGHTDALAGVDFGSGAAADLAKKGDMTAASFEGQEQSGAQGFTKKDVQRILADGKAADSDK